MSLFSTVAASFACLKTPVFFKRFGLCVTGNNCFLLCVLSCGCAEQSGGSFPLLEQLAVHKSFFASFLNIQTLQHKIFDRLLGSCFA